MGQFAIQAARNIQDAFADGLFNAMNGKFDNLANNFKRTIDKMVANALAAKLAESLFGDFGSSGNLGGILGSLFSFHSGGIVGQGGTLTHVNPLVFANAPRYHSGGVAGLAPAEVPAILQKGEEVLTRSDPRHRDNGGGNIQVTMNISTPDANSFRQSTQQIAYEASRAIGTAQRRNG